MNLKDAKELFTPRTIDEIDVNPLQLAEAEAFRHHTTVLIAGRPYQERALDHVGLR